MKYLTWKKKLKLALHLCLQVATTVCWKSRTFLVLKPMLFAIRYLLKLFFFWLWNLICSEKISWQQEKVLLDFKRKVNKGKETSIGSFQDKTEVIIFVWYWTYTNGKKIIFMNFFFRCIDESGQYHTTCVVERVIILGFGKQPTFVTASSKGNEFTSILLQSF